MNWRDIPDFEGRYQVSDTGSVRNAQTGRVLKPGRCTNAYLKVQLGRKHSRLVHRLVAAAFIPNPEAKPHTNHKNGKRADNRVDNLEWVTVSENHLHAHACLPRKRHSKTKSVVLTAGEYAKQFPSVSAAAVALGVVDGSVASAAGRGHKCRGYRVSLC